MVTQDGSLDLGWKSWMVSRPSSLQPLIPKMGKDKDKNTDTDIDWVGQNQIEIFGMIDYTQDGKLNLGWKMVFNMVGCTWDAYSYSR